VARTVLETLVQYPSPLNRGDGEQGFFVLWQTFFKGAENEHGIDGGSRGKNPTY